jgi:hypothetical protein
MLGSYIMIAGWLIFAYLLFTHMPQATAFLGQASSTNTGAIKALQGR